MHVMPRHNGMAVATASRKETAVLEDNAAKLIAALNRLMSFRRIEDANPESRDSGFDASHRPE